MYQLIDGFIELAKEMDGDIFPFIANKKEFVEGRDSVYYSGPYWDDLEAREMIHAVLKGKWLSSGEKVNKFEHEFSKKFNFGFFKTALRPDKNGYRAGWYIVGILVKRQTGGVQRYFDLRQKTGIKQKIGRAHV